MIKDLNLGFTDATMYANRGNKEMLNNIFVKNEYLDKIIQNKSIYFILGEKGTGKTTYATYLSNKHDSHDTIWLTKNIRDTDYEKFYEMKSEGF